MGSEWTRTILGNVVELKRGYDLPSQDRSPGSVPIVTSSGISDYHSEAKVKGPGVVTGRYGTIGQVYFIEEDYWPHNTTLYVRDFKGNDPRFISYFLRTIQYLSYSDKAAVPGVNRNHLHQALVTLPPLPEQRAIAAVLGALDDKIELNRQMNGTLEALARALFRSWFVDFEPVRAKMEGRPTGLAGEIEALFAEEMEVGEDGVERPRGWGVTTLGTICEQPQYGFTASAEQDAVGPKFLRITDINKIPWIDWYSVPHCRTTTRDFEKYRLNQGDIVIARMADPGHGAYIEDDVEAVFASYLIRFRPKLREYGRFLQYWLCSPSYWNIVDARKSGTTRANLNAQVLASFPLLLPPTELANAYKQTVDNLRARISANVIQSSTLCALRDGLLPKLMSGAVRANLEDSRKTKH